MRRILVLPWMMALKLISMHVSDKVNMANRILGVIRRTFIHLNTPI